MRNLYNDGQAWPNGGSLEGLQCRRRGGSAKKVRDWFRYRHDGIQTGHSG